jgi:hypothetical protein
MYLDVIKNSMRRIVNMGNLREQKKCEELQSQKYKVIALSPRSTKNKKRRETTEATYASVGLFVIMEVPGERTTRVEDEFAATVQDEFLTFLDRWVLSTPFETPAPKHTPQCALMQITRSHKIHHLK